MTTTANRIFVVYARASTGLKEWPIAAFFNRPDAEALAQQHADAAVHEGRAFRPAGGETRVVKARVVGYATWAKVPPLSKGF